jgi:hypothetical protein
MKKTCLSLFLASSSLFAALPPLAQSSREIQAVLSDSQLQTLLGSAEGVQEIIRTEGGYVVMTQNYLLRVDVEYLSASRPGPVPFRLHFQEPVELGRKP